MRYDSPRSALSLAILSSGGNGVGGGSFGASGRGGEGGAAVVTFQEASQGGVGQATQRGRRNRAEPHLTHHAVRPFDQFLRTRPQGVGERERGRVLKIKKKRKKNLDENLHHN
jgi:hypothetical protein